MGKQDIVYIAGHRGMVGSAMVRLLEREGFSNLITRSSAELDLLDQGAVRGFFQTRKVDYVVLAAARVGGIHANNSYPGEFIYQNLMIQANVIHEAFTAGVSKLLFLGSSCIYPKLCPQPMKEEYLLSGALEPTNEPYAIAKIAGIKMCESYNRQYGTAYRAVMPSNLYGPGDNYHLENSHVVPAIIRKCHLAKLAAAGDVQGIEHDERVYGPIPEGIKATLFESDGQSLRSEPYVQLWGSGKGRREFLHVDDMATGCYEVMTMGMEEYDHCLLIQGSDPLLSVPSFLNVGVGKDCTIREAAALIQKVVGFTGGIRYDATQPDGTPQKLLDVARLGNHGWRPAFSLSEGIEHTYRHYCDKLENAPGTDAASS
ncbi:MAG: GDP-L-fucose synthase [Desulfofustis sp.]|nr:GDP-L-fucose synthase [Desulfofustis sp.]